MTIESHGHEHEFEPEYGLPEALPANERILWQGSPDFATVALRIFHLRKVALYFFLMLAFRAGYVIDGGGSLVDGLQSLTVPGGLALMALGALTGLAWMTARTAVYTLTDKRIVMRIGIVLTLTFNLPLRQVESAALRQQPGGNGDIVITLGGEDHIAWLHLWPHVRPWQINRAQPMMRAVPDAVHVAALLSKAWSASTGVTVTTPPSVVAPEAGELQPRLQASST